MRQAISKTRVNRIALKNLVHGIDRRCAIGSAYTGIAGGESIVMDKVQNQGVEKYLNLVHIYL